MQIYTVLANLTVALGGAQTIKILHVDDEESFLEVASHFMQKVGGMKVHGATSVQSAMDMMSKTSSDVIVSDYQMPEMDGIDFLKMVRAGGSDMPFILFTGKGNPLYANRKLAELTGYSVDEILKLNAFEKLTRPAERSAWSGLRRTSPSVGGRRRG